MATLSELRAVRLEKINILNNAGMNPYPASVPRTHTLKQIVSDFTELEQSAATVSITGRIMSLRGQGAIMFATLFDGTERFQVVFKRDEIDEVLFDLFSEVVDLGDFISVTGTVFTTQRGAQSVLCKTWMMATKSLLPIPSEHYGLEDDDERYRKRYLDILLNPKIREIFEKRSDYQVESFVKNCEKIFN